MVVEFLLTSTMVDTGTGATHRAPLVGLFAGGCSVLESP